MITIALIPPLRCCSLAWRGERSPRASLARLGIGLAASYLLVGVGGGWTH
ncbi:MAG: hypothetical protein R2838_01735 [Caldilineaceae bacterium]